MNVRNRQEESLSDKQKSDSGFLSAPQRKELGVLVSDCSCLALDLHRVFSLYWGLKYKDFIPSFWSKRLFALYNRNEPLELMFNSTKAQAYISVGDNGVEIVTAEFFSQTVREFESMLTHCLRMQRG